MSEGLTEVCILTMAIYCSNIYQFILEKETISVLNNVKDSFKTNQAYLIDLKLVIQIQSSGE